MKLSAYARSHGVSYRTAWRWFKAGKVAGFQADTGTFNVTEPIVETVPANAKRRRKQQLNACMKPMGQPTGSLNDDKLEAFARNQIGRALNPMLDELPGGSKVALERLTVKDMRFKSRQMNRALRASQLGYVRDKLKFKLDEGSIGYRSVQPAYSSQQGSQSGFTLPMNRRSQAEFHCLWCGFKANADENAAQVIAERFGDDALNRLPFREVETVLAIRFMRRLPDARSASAGLELQPVQSGCREVRGWLPLNRFRQSISPVNTRVIVVYITGNYLLSHVEP